MTEEPTLICLDDDLSTDLLQNTSTDLSLPSLPEGESLSPEKARAELISYAGLLTRAPDIFLWGTTEYKMRLIGFFAPHAFAFKQTDHTLNTDFGADNEARNSKGNDGRDDFFPDVCYHCFGLFGWTRSGRVRERCSDCKRLINGRRFLWSNVQYEFGRIAPLLCNTEGLFSQIVAKHYSPNATQKERTWEIQIPAL